MRRYADFLGSFDSFEGIKGGHQQHWGVVGGDGGGFVTGLKVFV
jgi:hypothetical protein